MIAKPQGYTVSTAFIPKKYTNIEVLTTSDGVTKKATYEDNVVRSQVVAAQNDMAFMFFNCYGNETRLEITMASDTDAGIVDLYVNGALDTSGLDNYAAAFALIDRTITLTQKIRPGLNTLTFIVSSKNASSSDYFIYIVGANLQ